MREIPVCAKRDRAHLSRSQPAALPTCDPVACNYCGIYNLCLPLGLESADMSLLDSMVRRKEVFKRGQLLFRPGKRFDYIYAIRSGSVKSYLCTEDGRTQITGFHIAGELLGLSALTCFLQRSPFEVNRCPLPGLDRPEGCPRRGQSGGCR